MEKQTKSKLKAKWYRLWFKRRLKKNEFHPSLNMDMDLLLELDDDERQEYYRHLADLRWIAHEEDLKEEDMRRNYNN